MTPKAVAAINHQETSMGYGPIVNGKQQPITPWKGSWAEQQQQRREGSKQWPIGSPPVPLNKERK